MSDLKEFGIFKTVTAKDPIDMAIGLAMIEEAEQAEQENQEEEAEQVQKKKK